jgi:hypothetical protein
MPDGGRLVTVWRAVQVRLARVVAAHLLQDGEYLLLVTLGDASLKQWHQCVLVRLDLRREPRLRSPQRSRR